MDISELSSLLRESVAGLHKRLRKQSQVVKTYSMTEIETIAHLFRNDQLLPTELAGLTRVKTQSMSQILKKLEEETIIKRTPSKDDKRKVYISLTAYGKKIVEKTKYERDQWLKEAMEKTLSDKEKELLIKVLPVLNKLIQAT